MRRVWLWAVSILLAGVLLYFSLRGVEWTTVWRTIAAAHWSILAAAGLMTCGSYFLRSIRWRILLNAESSLNVGTVFWANMAGYLGNNFLPARAGEVVRSVLVSKRSSLSKTYVLTTALSERLMDVIALVLWSSIVLLNVNPKPVWMEQLSRTMAIAAGCGVICVIVLPHAGGVVKSLLQRIPLPGAIRTGLAGLVEQILLGLRAFHSWKRLTGFAVLTVAVWMVDAWATVISAHALGLRIDFAVALLLLTGMGLGSALPSTPGYIGIYQFVAVTVLTPFGMSRDDAVAYILVAQAGGYVVVLLLGLPGLYILGRGGDRALAFPREKEPGSHFS
jgi:glycosyltransferase 2 family protein